MRIAKHIALSLFIILCIVSCGGSSDPISRMEALASELENNSTNYTSDEELNQLAKLEGKCYAYLVKGAAKMAEDKIDKQAELFNSALEGFLEVFE